MNKVITCRGKKLETQKMLLNNLVINEYEYLSIILTKNNYGRKH